MQGPALPHVAPPSEIVAAAVCDPFLLLHLDDGSAALMAVEGGGGADGALTLVPGCAAISRPVPLMAKGRQVIGDCRVLMGFI